MVGQAVGANFSGTVTGPSRKLPSTLPSSAAISFRVRFFHLAIYQSTWSTATKCIEEVSLQL
jgi:hypothetical protein